MGSEIVAQSEVLDRELEDIFSDCLLEGGEKASVEILIISCLKKYADGNLKLKNILLNKLDPDGSNELISKSEFKIRLKEFILNPHTIDNEIVLTDESVEQVQNVEDRPDYWEENDFWNANSVHLEDSFEKLRILKDKNILLENSLVYTDQKIISLEKKLGRLQRESCKKIEYYKAETKRMENLIVELQLKCSELEKKCCKLASAHASAEVELINFKLLKNKYEETEINYNFLNKENAEKKCDLKIAETINKSLQKKLEDTCKSREALIQEITHLKNEVTQLINNQAELLIRIESLQHEKQSLILELSELKISEAMRFIKPELQITNNGKPTLQSTSSFGSFDNVSIKNELAECGYSLSTDSFDAIKSSNSKLKCKVIDINESFSFLNSLNLEISDSKILKRFNSLPVISKERKLKKNRNSLCTNSVQTEDISDACCECLSAMKPLANRSSHGLVCSSFTQTCPLISFKGQKEINVASPNEDSSKKVNGLREELRKELYTCASCPDSMYSKDGMLSLKYSLILKRRLLPRNHKVLVNSDGLSPLDVAVLSNNRSLTKMLIAFGAQEGNEFSSGDSLLCHLKNLNCEANQKVCELSGQDTRNHGLWQRRAKGIGNMITGFTQARPPDIPSLVAVDVTGSHTVNVRYLEPDNSDSPICTKYKIEWSTDNEFHNLSGFRVILDPRQQECTIDELVHGQRYYFRVSCGNIRGWGHPRPATPTSVIPSSWRDLVKREDRVCTEGLAQLDKLFSEIRSSRPDIKALQETSAGERRKKTTIKQLFTAASKFQKHLRRGVYLSCLLYHEDKVLLTNEDFLPVIEVDETYPGSIYHDFHWLLKIACTWDDVKWLKQDMEKSLSSPGIHFRIKLLQAATQMQTALSVQDLGQLYHKPLRDSEGTIVICTVNYVRSPKTVSVLNSRWIPLGKLNKRTINLATDASLSDILMSSIPDQITYHQVSSIKLPRGLYLGYLKMRSCVDVLQVLVPAKAPNVPPHCKIRDNPHITAEEWETLTVKYDLIDKSTQSEQQKTFVEQVAATVNRLLTYMQVSNDQAQNHRLYDAEVVEVSSDVSLLVVVPPTESACSAPGQGEILLQRPDLIPLPVQVFEMVHLGTYHKQLVARYSRLSCIIELDTALAQHSHREAFSTSEVSAAKERLTRLEALQAQLNSAWKQARWLLDVLAFARDKGSLTPTNIIRHLLSLHPKRSHDSIGSHNGLLLPPDTKGVKSRGSWPGPGVSRLLGAATTELSRSEHQLSSAGTSTPPPVLRLPPPKPLSPPALLLEQPRLPPSKSEDTLALHTRVMAAAHSRNRTSASATTSPLLSIRPAYGSGSLYSLSSDDSGGMSKSKSESEEGATVPAPSPGILQVYAAYETGLAAGTSLKIHVSPRTTAREVVDLVVKQLNMAVVLKGKEGPIYSSEQLSDFCLVAVIGARERCLRDDFKPLQLQNPWKKGRLYVRQKHDVLAALEQSSRHSAYL